MGRAVKVDASLRLEQATALKARGHALEARGTAASLAGALHCYETALALLGPHPSEHERVRIAQGILWMNQGNARQRLAAYGPAIAAYDEALVFLPVNDDPAVQNARGAAWLNRGRALQARGGASDPAEAIRSQQQALALLRPLVRPADPDSQLNLAGACLNLATLLAGERRLTEATDAADEGLEIVRRPGAAQALLRPVAARLFQFGAQLYAVHQPQFLAEFVRENIDPADVGFAAAARAAVTRAREHLGRTRFLSTANPAALRLVELWRDLAALERELPAPAA
jgi:tetratricopeptide (TPR) repeat protein